MPVAYFVTPNLWGGNPDRSTIQQQQSGPITWDQLQALSETPITAGSLNTAPTAIAVGLANFSVRFDDDTYDGYITNLMLSAVATCDGSNINITWKYQLTGDDTSQSTQCEVSFVVMVTYSEDQTAPENYLTTLTPGLAGSAPPVPSFAAATPAGTPYAVAPVLGGFNVTFDVDDGEVNTISAWAGVQAGAGNQLVGTGGISVYGDDEDNGQGTVDIATLAILDSAPTKGNYEVQMCSVDAYMGPTTFAGSTQCTFTGPIVRGFAALQGFYYSYEEDTETGIYNYQAAVTATVSQANAHKMDIAFGGGAYEEVDDNVTVTMNNNYVRVLVLALVDVSKES